jgi:hypothetical protein
VDNSHIDAGRRGPISTHIRLGHKSVTSAQ